MSTGNEMEANLLNLPPEILFQICSYLDTFTLVEALMKVCSKFESILLNEPFWMERTNRKFPGIKLFFPEQQNNPWSQLHYQIEKNSKFLDDIFFRRLEKVSNDDVHGVSSGMKLKLVADDQLCVSVSHDCSIALWTSYADDRFFLVNKDFAHADKVTCVDSMNTESFCTGSRDTTCKVWSLDTFESISTLNCKGKVASICCQDALVAAGLHTSRVEVHDTRVPSSQVIKIAPKLGKRKIVGVTLDGDKLYVARNDGRIASYDLRTQGVVKSTRVLCDNSDNDLSYSYRKGTIVMADQYDGALSILNKDLDELALLDNQDFFKGAMKQNDYDIFVGRTNCVEQMLKTDCEGASGLGYLHLYQNEDIFVMDIEYVFDTAIYLGKESGNIIMYRREDKTITL